MKQPCVYLMANHKNGTLYVGVTSNLLQRAWLHRNHVVEGFTKTHSLVRLVWYEQHPTMLSAIQREKAIKRWRRAWKLRLVEEQNPDWVDLYENLAAGKPG